MLMIILVFGALTNDPNKGKLRPITMLPDEFRKQVQMPPFR